MAKRFKQIVSESFDLIEGRMSQLAVDMDELDDRAFKAKHKRSKQEMSTALNKPIKPQAEMDEEVEQIDEKFVVVDKNKKIMHVHGTVDAAKKKAQSKGLDPEEHVMTHYYWKRTHGSLRNEEVEQIDEISQDKLMAYRSAAKKQGTGIQDRMKVGGGDWSKDGKDTKTLKKRMSGYKMAGRKVNPGLAASMGKAPRVPANEEVEQVDESMASATKRAEASRQRAIKNAAKQAKRMGGSDEAIKNAMRAHDVFKRDEHHVRKHLMGEEVEQIDEVKKGDYVVHPKGGHVGQVTNVSGDKKIADVKWNKTGRQSSHPMGSLQKMKEETEQVDESERAKQMQAGWELLRKRRKDNEKAVKDMKDMAPHMKNPALGEESENVDESSMKPIKLTPGWGDGGKSMRANKGKLAGNQHKIDANDDGKISADDFKILRNKNKARYQ